MKKKLIFLLCFSSYLLSAQDTSKIIDSEVLPYKLSTVFFDNIDLTLFKDFLYLEINDDKKIHGLSQQGIKKEYDFQKQQLKEEKTYSNEIITQLYYDTINSRKILSKLGTNKIEIYNSINNKLLDTLLVKEKYISSFDVSLSGNIIATVSEKQIYIWCFNKTEWIKKTYSLPNYLTSLSFVDETLILVGTTSGEVLQFDSSLGKVVKLKKLHTENTSLIMKSKNEDFVSTDGKTVSLWNYNFSKVRRIDSKITFISALHWLNDSLLIIGGLRENIEIWNVFQNKIFQSINISQKKLNNNNAIELLKERERASYIFWNNNNIVDSIQVDYQIDALDFDENQNIIVGLNNFDINSYVFTDKKLKLINSINIYEHLYKHKNQKILSIESVNEGKNIFIGNQYGHLYMDAITNEISLVVGNRWASYSQSNLNSFKDIALLKSNNAMASSKNANDEYQRAFILWEVYESAFNQANKKSILYKEWKKQKIKNQGEMKFPLLKELKNPSGFCISPTKKFLATYDSNGLIQIIKIKGLEPIIDTLFDTSIKKVFFRNDDKLIFINQKNEVYLYNFATKGNTITYLITIDLYDYEIVYNGKNKFAFLGSNNRDINILNLETRKSYLIYSNYNNDFQIQNLKLDQRDNQLVWTLNPNLALNTSKKEKNVDIFNDKIITKITSSRDENTIVVANNYGDVLVFEKKDK